MKTVQQIAGTLHQLPPLVVGLPCCTGQLNTINTKQEQTTSAFVDALYRTLLSSKLIVHQTRLFGDDARF
jgi:hypothetical protein